MKTMKHIYQSLIYALMSLVSTKGLAQLQIVTNYAHSSSLTLFQINDFSVYNPGGSILNSTIEVSIDDNHNGKRILHEYVNHSIVPGLNSFLTVKFDCQYYENSISKELRSNGILKEGNFSICILVRSANIESPVKNCDQVSLMNNRDIHLVSPFNEEKIETLNPFLQWISSFEPGTNYHLRLVQLSPYSSNEQALSENIALLEFDTKDLSSLYPFTAPVLEYKKKYVWQIYAFSEDRSIIGYSEPWRFTPARNERTESSKGDCYRLVYRNLNNGNYLFRDVIRFGYNNYANENVLTYSITDLTTGKKCSNLPVVNLVNGFNKIDLVLGEEIKVEENHSYFFEINNKNRERYQFNFCTSGK